MTTYQQARDWHAGRCAACGTTRALVDDHCHATGLLRGWLCRACNRQEARDQLSLFSAYRSRPPTVLLQWAVPYGDLRREGAQPLPWVVATFGERPTDPRAAAGYLARFASGTDHS
ncbi:endonuclease domain-containing protein [Streptomyces tubercidicus]